MRLRRPTERRGVCAAAWRGAATAPGRARPAAARPAPWVPPRRAPPRGDTQPAPAGRSAAGRDTPWPGAWGCLCSLLAVYSTREVDARAEERCRASCCHLSGTAFHRPTVLSSVQVPHWFSRFECGQTRSMLMILLEAVCIPVAMCPKTWHKAEVSQAGEIGGK